MLRVLVAKRYCYFVTELIFRMVSNSYMTNGGTYMGVGHMFHYLRLYDRRFDAYRYGFDNGLCKIGCECIVGAGSSSPRAKNFLMAFS